MPALPRLQADDLKALRRREVPAAGACSCDTVTSRSWESVVAPLAEPAFECVGTLLQAGPQGDPEAEATLTEWHPDGTSYWSPTAPIAVAWFPCNRCSVWRCRTCGRGFLQYTEFGGYYVDHRLRAVEPSLVV